jgi:hypothetical protein
MDAEMQEVEPTFLLTEKETGLPEPQGVLWFMHGMMTKISPGVS